MVIVVQATNCFSCSESKTSQNSQSLGKTHLPDLDILNGRSMHWQGIETLFTHAHACAHIHTAEQQCVREEITVLTPSLSLVVPLRTGSDRHENIAFSTKLEHEKLQFPDVSLQLFISQRRFSHFFNV